MKNNSMILGNLIKVTFFDRFLVVNSIRSCLFRKMCATVYIRL